MAETWEVLTLRGLLATDGRAEEFTGTLVIHRVGSSEPVESVSVRVKPGPSASARRHPSDPDQGERG